MKNEAPTTFPCPADAQAVWDEARIMTLCRDVGPEGVDDLLRLFHADMPFLLARLNASLAAHDGETVDRVLAALRGAAGRLGLKSVEALAASLRTDPLDQAIGAQLAAELARARAFPPPGAAKQGPLP